jgi:CXXX repeat peptide maturase
VGESRNPHLLQLRHAPICSRCDAYQCRRCVYLSQLMTGELNTPSRQQCVAAHLERNASRRLLRRLRPFLRNSDEMPEIPEIDYLDPLELVHEERSHGQIELRQVRGGRQ